MTRIQLLQDIVIPAGTIMERAGSKVERCIPFYEALVGFGPDFTGSFTLDIEAIENQPDRFAILEP